MESIYNELIQRNELEIKSNGFGFDPLLLKENDERRCLAIYNNDTMMRYSALDELRHFCCDKFPQDVTFGCDGREENDNALLGHLHHTFMQVVSFSQAHLVDIYNVKKIVSVLRDLNIPRYSVTFNMLAVVKSGLIMLGIPSIDVNRYREEFRETMSVLGLPMLEPYKNDIVHSTLFRWSHEPTCEETNRLFEIVQKYNQSDKEPLAFLKVDSFTVSKASWKMKPRELRCEHTVQVDLL